MKHTFHEGQCVGFVPAQRRPANPCKRQGLCGKTGLAAHTAICSVLLIVFQLPTGLGNATSAVVGHATGSGVRLWDPRIKSVMMHCCDSLVLSPSSEAVAQRPKLP